ncbi:MAG: hypothetical protein H0T51_20210 [Pirellulales bacterium]|nr:hypothetical protein [Pirellulales bacterium]
MGSKTGLTTSAYERYGGSAVPILLTLMLSACAPGLAWAGAPALVRLVDGSSIAPTGDGKITFRNVGAPDGRQTIYSSRNPIINGHNLYAVDLVRTAAGWTTYFGGWKTAGQENDRIYRSTIAGLDASGAWSDPQVAIDSGVYQHVNDPSVVISGGVQHMVYTAARQVNHPRFGAFFRDWINYSSSTDGVAWSPASGVTSAEIVLTDPNGVGIGTITSIARPSLVKTDFGWKLWFDGRADNQPDSSLHCYLAHSTTAKPTSFELVHRYADIGGFPGFFEPDVVLRPDGTYFGVVQRHFNGLFQVASDDGVEFEFDGRFFDGDHPFHPRDHVSNPGLIYDQLNDVNYGVGFGTANSGLADHDIAFAYSQYVVHVRSPPASPGGQPVWHVFAVSNDAVEQRVSVFNFSDFDRVRLIDPTTGKILLEQDFTNANQSDVWELRFPPGVPADFNEEHGMDGIGLQ